MVAQATGEKVDKAKREKKCSQFLLYCVDVTVGTIMPWDVWMEAKPTFFPHFGEQGGKKGGGKWRFLLKN